MRRTEYNSKEEAIADIERAKKEDFPCLEMLTNDIFEFPLYLPITSYITDDPPKLGTIKAKFTLGEVKPMISVGEWVLYYFYDVEIIDVKFNNSEIADKDVIEDLFFSLGNIKDKKIVTGNVMYSHFYRVMDNELRFFQRICDIKGNLTIGQIIWNA